MTDTKQSPEPTALEIAIKALDSIALAGMSGSGQESEEGLRDWHAQHAWDFIAIAARAKMAIATIRSAEHQMVEPVAAPTTAQKADSTCACRWDGKELVASCELRAAWREAIHEWAERAKKGTA